MRNPVLELPGCRNHTACPSDVDTTNFGTSAVLGYASKGLLHGISLTLPQITLSPPPALENVV